MQRVRIEIDGERRVGAPRGRPGRSPTTAASSPPPTRRWLAPVDALEDHRRPPHLPLAPGRVRGRADAGAAVLLPQAAEHAERAPASAAAPGRHAVPQLRGRARGGRRHAHARRRGARRARPRLRLRARQRRRTARLPPRRPRRDAARQGSGRVPADRSGGGHRRRVAPRRRLHAAHPPQRRDRPGGRRRRSDLGLPLSARRPLPADHARAGRRRPDRHPGQLAADGARRRGRGRDRRHARAPQPRRGLGRRPERPRRAARGLRQHAACRARDRRGRGGADRVPRGAGAEPRTAHGAGAQRVLDDDLAARPPRASPGWPPRPRTRASTRSCSASTSCSAPAPTPTV